jgi:hypothetical protein
MYKYYNAHPKELRVNDCVVRAYCTATGKEYNESRRELNKARKELGCSSYKEKDFANKFYSKYEKLSFPAKKGCNRMNGFLFAIEYPKGNYILNMAGHHTCCVDGVILDTWDCTNKCVYNAWKIN